jgi:hypothetical protein
MNQVQRPQRYAHRASLNTFRRVALGRRLNGKQPVDGVAGATGAQACWLLPIFLLVRSADVLRGRIVRVAFCC